MTIAISIKVNDGVVLATDSRASYVQQTNNGSAAVIHAFDNAIKIANLHKAMPVGMVASGVGSMGRRSLTTIAKDFRALISGSDPKWTIDPAAYTVKDIVDRFHEYVFAETYIKEFAQISPMPSVGFLISGYSVGEQLPETWELAYNGPSSPGPRCISAPSDVGICWIGDGEALFRLVLGYSQRLSALLGNLAFLQAGQAQQIMDAIKGKLDAPIYNPDMPIQDAINLAEFLAKTTAAFTRYIPGGATVGGPTEIAAITRHEGFKWVARKHFYDRNLNH